MLSGAGCVCAGDGGGCDCAAANARGADCQRRAGGDGFDGLVALADLVVAGAGGGAGGEDCGVAGAGASAAGGEWGVTGGDGKLDGAGGGGVSLHDAGGERVV